MGKGRALQTVGALGAGLAGLAVRDLLQRRHSILRNYPVVGHLRFLLEDIRPEIQQYFIERDWDGRPYDRDTRSIIYERAKGTNEEQPFGTELDVYEPGYRVPRPLHRAAASPGPATSRGGRWSGLRQAVCHVAAQRVGHELRGVVRQRDPRAEQGGGDGRLRPRHR